MKTDLDIQREVQHQLQCDPRVDERGVGVNVHKGVITLVGTVPHYAERQTAAEIAEYIDGVCAIANEIEVRIAKTSECSDTEIAEAAAAALHDKDEYFANQVKAIVTSGWIRLSGQLETQDQRAGAELAVRNLPSVKGVVNCTTLKPATSSADAQQSIEDALQVHAALEAEDIVVEFKNSVVTLRGYVQSHQERNDAAFAAWSGAGVSKVEKLLAVQP